MENKNNDKVPMAILSCFLIAFILQGTLKLSGVFIFDKALNWEIFKIIDSIKWLQMIYFSIINSITMYCLSFTLSLKPYSKKWYHYFIIIVTSFGITALKYYVELPMQMQFVYDVITYIIVPCIITLTMPKENSINSKNDLNTIISIISMHILLYFCYLGLSYWSNLMCSLYPKLQVALGSSASFLVVFELYIALFAIMITPKHEFQNKGE